MGRPPPPEAGQRPASPVGNDRGKPARGWGTAVASPQPSFPASAADPGVTAAPAPLSLPAPRRPPSPSATPKGVGIRRPRKARVRRPEVGPATVSRGGCVPPTSPERPLPPEALRAAPRCLWGAAVRKRGRAAPRRTRAPRAAGRAGRAGQGTLAGRPRRGPSPQGGSHAGCVGAFNLLQYPIMLGETLRHLGWEGPGGRAAAGGAGEGPRAEAALSWARGSGSRRGGFPGTKRGKWPRRG